MSNLFKKKLALLFLSLSFTFLILEILFTFFVVYSDSTGALTLASRRWYKKYWHPINTFGFRDHDYVGLITSLKNKATPKAQDREAISSQKKGAEPSRGIKMKKLVFVVGDSFAAGAGIKSVEDRFSNIIQREIGNRYLVINMAKGGWNTTEEVNQLSNFPLTPDIIILSYYVNDIESIAAAHGQVRPVYVQKPGPLVSSLIEKSSFLNYVYWRWYRYSNSFLFGHHLAWLNNIYQDEKIWNKHKEELMSVVRFSEEVKAELLVVVFPNLTDVKGSIGITEKVAQAFEDKNIQVLNLSETLRSYSSKQIIVNQVDNHANEFVHDLVGNRLASTILKRL